MTLRNSRSLLSLLMGSRRPWHGAAGITDFFISRQLIPASSGFDSRSAQKDKAHFPALQRETGLSYAEMLFFDDEPPNVQKVILSALHRRQS